MHNRKSGVKQLAHNHNISCPDLDDRSEIVLALQQQQWQQWQHRQHRQQQWQEPNEQKKIQFLLMLIRPIFIRSLFVVTTTTTAFRMLSLCLEKRLQARFRIATKCDRVSDAKVKNALAGRQCDQIWLNFATLAKN